MIDANELREITKQAIRKRNAELLERNQATIDDICDKLINYAKIVCEYYGCYEFDKMMLMSDLEFIVNYFRDYGFKVNLDCSNREHCKMNISWEE